MKTHNYKVGPFIGQKTKSLKIRTNVLAQRTCPDSKTKFRCTSFDARCTSDEANIGLETWCFRCRKRELIDFTLTNT